MKQLQQNDYTNISEGFDRVGSVILIHEEPEKIFRLITPTYADLFKELFHNDSLNNLFNHGLVKSFISTKYTGPQGEMIIEHEKIPHINYLFEWSRFMTKEAAVFLLGLTIKAIEQGLFIKDSHAFNITFSNRQNYFFDYGSIEKNKERLGFVWIDHFFHNFVFPINYFQITDGKKYRSFAITHLNKPFNTWRFMQFSFIRNPIHTLRSVCVYLYFISARKFVTSRDQQLRLLTGLKKYVEQLTIPFFETRWKDYYKSQNDKFKQIQTWDKKMNAIRDIAQSLDAETILDIGGNTGLYSKIVKKFNPSVKHITLIDYDESAIDIAFQHECDIDDAFVVDIKYFDKATETYFRPPKKTVYPSFLSRSRSDLVLMLALMHHLVYFQSYSFDHIASIAADSSKKWLLLEFISNEDVHIKKWFKKGIQKKESYTLTNLRASVEKYFNVISVTACGEANEDRYLLLCAKKNEH